jgi:hypothetical protein
VRRKRTAFLMSEKKLKGVLDTWSVEELKSRVSALLNISWLLHDASTYQASTGTCTPLDLLRTFTAMSDTCEYLPALV